MKKNEKSLTLLLVYTGIASWKSNLTISSKVEITRTL